MTPLRPTLVLVLMLFGACKPDTPSALAPQNTARPAAVKTARSAECDGFDPAQDKVPDDWLLCSKDEDCVRAHTSCCDCSGGDNGVAVAGRWEECLAVTCEKPVTCAAEEVCQDRTICSEGMCALGSPTPEPPSPEGCAGYVAGSADVPAALLTCSNDADCTLAQNECCPCSAGGERVAVSADSAHCITPRKCSEHTMCTTWNRCDRFVAGCRDGGCIRVDTEPEKTIIEHWDE